MLGRTLDDAAGEAFDKGARMLGLGYPGGAALERLAASGDPDAFVFPGSRPIVRAAARERTGRRSAQGLDFSFAGLKTALLYRLRELSEAEAQARRGADLAASYQAAIVDSLIVRAERAPGGDRPRSSRDRRRRGRQRRAAQATCGRSGQQCTCRRASCARTTRR